MTESEKSRKTCAEPVFLITYDLNREATRPPIVATLKAAWSEHLRLSESSYVVRTPMSPQEIYETLEPLLDANDVLCVIRLGSQYEAGTGEENEWLETNLTGPQ